jgi:hypothetical protein
MKQLLSVLQRYPSNIGLGHRLHLSQLDLTPDLVGIFFNETSQHTFQPTLSSPLDGAAHLQSGTVSFSP